jgi:hypothetical protein
MYKFHQSKIHEDLHYVSDYSQTICILSTLLIKVYCPSEFWSDKKGFKIATKWAEKRKESFHDHSLSIKLMVNVAFDIAQM